MNKRNLLLLTVAVILVAVFYFLIHKKNESIPRQYANFNVVLVTIDTLRADHLPAYGYSNIRTPNIDKLAADSLLFEDAVAQVPMTLPSHASILTGQIPPLHGIRDNAGFHLDPKIPTLASILKENGYKTAAFVSSFVLDSQFGLDRGFDLYSDDFTLAQARVVNTEVYRRAEETQIEVDRWLDQNNNGKFFLWVHYYDPHDPYEPPEPYRTQYVSSPYDGEIAYTDHVLGNLIEHLKRLDLLEKTIVILTGDHGESLGEHHEQTHSLFIYNATLHVPFIIRLPNSKPQRISHIARHVDIAPTLLEWLGLPRGPSMQGINLMKDPQFAYSESLFPQLHYGWSPLRSITTPEYRFIEAPTPELYDRKSDPAETNNVFSTKKDIANDLRRKLQEIVIKDNPQVTPQPVDAETEEKLKALGYTGGTTRSTPESLKIDPKDKIHLLEALSRAGVAMKQKDYQHVLQEAQLVLQEQSDLIDAQFLLSSAYLHLGERDKALAAMLQTIRLKPDHTQTLYNLAFFYQIQGNLAEAERWYLQLLRSEPENLHGNLNLASLYLQSGQTSQAQPYVHKVIAWYEQSIQNSSSPEIRSDLLEKLAEIQYKTGDLDSSEKNLKNAIQLRPENPSLHFHLGSIYQAKNRIAEAKSEYSRALELAETLKNTEPLQRELRQRLDSLN